jgi:hypothetical protein
MPLTPDIQRAHALVELAALLKKADIIRERHFRDRPIHVTGFDIEREGRIRTVRPMSFCDGVRLELGNG